MSEKFVVGISDYKVVKNEGILVTYALGSCVGICIYDSRSKVGGLSHIMLPDSSMFSKNEVNRMKFADTAIVDMVRKLKLFGVDECRLTAKIAGGAQMFQVQAGSAIGSIGDRNVDSVKMVLGSLRIPIIAENTKQNYGRTVFFDLTTGIMKVQTLNRSVLEL